MKDPTTLPCTSGCKLHWFGAEHRIAGVSYAPVHLGMSEATSSAWMWEDTAQYVAPEVQYDFVYKGKNQNGPDWALLP